MTMMFNQSAVIVRAGTKTDRGGNVVPDWSPLAVARLPVSGLNIQPATQMENGPASDSAHGDVQRTVVITGYRVQSAEGTAPDITAADRIEWRGLLFEVNGEVAEWPDLFIDRPHHIEFVMVRATG